jgi:Putative DNA-binding domain/Putative RNA methylase family UPF0020
MPVDLSNLRKNLQAFDFRKLFVDDLGWSKPSSTQTTLELEGLTFELKQVAQLSGVQVFEASSSDGQIPDAKNRKKIHDEVSEQAYENLLIFTDKTRTQSIWYWAKRDGKKTYPRDHFYDKNQSGDLLLSKIQAMFVDIGELDTDGNIPVVDVARKLQAALDVEKTTKKFYKEFEQQHVEFVSLIEGIADERDKAWYASVLLNRLMFIYFLQGKGFVDNKNYDYLQEKLQASQASGKDRYYSEFLNALFFEGFAKPENTRTSEINALLGKIKYLNGGLFLPHSIEQKYEGKIRVPDKAFENLLGLFTRYSWNLDDMPGGKDDEINPDVLGYIFEKYINQKAFGAYYTRPEITEYLCERTIYPLILERMNEVDIPGLPKARKFDSVPELLMRLDNTLAKRLLYSGGVLSELKLLDPACGSGAFLIAAMKTLFNVYASAIGWVEAHGNHELKDWLKKQRGGHQNFFYFIKKRIITDNLFGVDLMAEATEIARLRLFLALVSSAHTIDELEPLPNIDFNIQSGNSLIGLLHVDEKEYDKLKPQGGLFTKRYPEIVAERLRNLESYRHAAELKIDDLRNLRDTIEQGRGEAVQTLNEILRDDFGELNIKFEEATWDEAKGKEGKSKKRAVTIDDIQALEPFHWGFEFSEVMAKGGFDAIITNPPWETFKPIDREFAGSYTGTLDRRTTNVKEFQAEFHKLLQDSKIRQDYENYLSSFPHVSAFYRSAHQYKYQGRGDINLYKLFTEQCVILLRPGGLCGIVIPSGIYSDLGTKDLRELLFRNTQVTGLFCFENRKNIFEDVDSRFKFVVLTFEKGKETLSFPASFMRHFVRDLTQFPEENAIEISVNFVKQLSPDSLSVMEFKSEVDVEIARKMARYPLLGEKLENVWNLSLTNEFHMTGDSGLFKTSSTMKRLPLYEGKMIWHFEPHYAEPRYWVDEKEGHAAVLGKNGKDIGQLLDYQRYRFGCRSITGNTNERTMIACILPRNVFCGHSLQVSKHGDNPITDAELLFFTSVMSSYIVDFSLRQRVATQMTMFFIYQTPIPRLTSSDPRFLPIVTRAAKLICTGPDFDDLAAAVGLSDHTNGVTDPTERAKLRAELDGMVAHLYELTEADFKHILATFPLVATETKEAALQAFKDFAPKQGDLEIAQLIAAGESARLEFKSTARWNVKANMADKKMEEVILKTIAAFWNAEGGTLLIGVEDSGNIYGLDADYKTLGNKGNRDGFELFLTDLLLKDQPELRDYLQVSFHSLEGKDVCRVVAKAASKPVYVELAGVEKFFARVNNSTRELSIKQAHDYIQDHWK